MASQTGILEEAKTLVRSCMEDGKLDANEMLRIGVFVAEKVNRIEGLSGQEKKKLVLEAVKEAVELVVPKSLHQEVGSNVALEVLPSVLDIAVQAARGKIQLGKVVGAAKEAVAESVKKPFSLGCFVDCVKGMFGKIASGSEKAVPVVVEPVAAASVKRAAFQEPVPLPLEPVSPRAAVTAVSLAPESVSFPVTIQESEPPVSLEPVSAEPAEPAEQQPPLTRQETALEIESQTESTPEASPEAPPLETRPPEESSKELPNTATEEAALQQ